MSGMRPQAGKGPRCRRKTKSGAKIGVKEEQIGSFPSWGSPVWMPQILGGSWRSHNPCERPKQELPTRGWSVPGTGMWLWGHLGCSGSLAKAPPAPTAHPPALPPLSHFISHPFPSFLFHSPHPAALPWERSPGWMLLSGRCTPGSLWNLLHGLHPWGRPHPWDPPETPGCPPWVPSKPCSHIQAPGTVHP